MKTGGAKGNMVLVRGGPAYPTMTSASVPEPPTWRFGAISFFSVTDLDLCFIVDVHE